MAGRQMNFTPEGWFKAWLPGAACDGAQGICATRLSFQYRRSVRRASGSFCGTVCLGTAASLLAPWHMAQVRISPGANVTQNRSRTTLTEAESVSCHVIARCAGTRAANEPSLPSWTLPCGPAGFGGLCTEVSVMG